MSLLICQIHYSSLFWRKFFVLLFMELKISSNFQFCWNKFANFLSKYLLKTKYLACFSTVFLFNWKTNVIGKWPIMSIWIILLMNWISWTVFVMLWSMAVTVYLFTLVSLFIVGIILQKQIIQKFFHRFIIFNVQKIEIEVSYKCQFLSFLHF